MNNTKCSSFLHQNDTSEGRQNNRRTEFKITGTDYKAPKEKKEKKGDS